MAMLHAINITRNQGTALPCPLYHSGAVGIDMIACET